MYNTHYEVCKLQNCPSRVLILGQDPIILDPRLLTTVGDGVTHDLVTVPIFVPDIRPIPTICQDVDFKSHNDVHGRH